MPQPNPKHKLMCTGWLADLTAECSSLTEYAGVHVPDVGSEFARELIPEPYPAVEVG